MSYRLFCKICGKKAPPRAWWKDKICPDCRNSGKRK